MEEKSRGRSQRGRLTVQRMVALAPLHAATSADGRSLRFFTTAGQVSDYTGATALLGDLPKANGLLAIRGYNADWFRDALKDKEIKHCIPVRVLRQRYRR